MAAIRSVDLALDCTALLGEGPCWDAADQSLLWVDIEAHEIHRFQPDQGTEVVTALSQPVSAAIPREGSGLVVTLRDGFAFYDEHTAVLQLLVDPESDRPGNRMNDAKCDPVGRLWAGTMSTAGQPGAGSLYRLEGSGGDLRLERVLGEVTLSNGLGWSPDASLMYYVDTPTQRVDVFAYDLAAGSLEQRRRFVELPATAGSPDGMAVDADGCVWVALWDGSAVRRYTPTGVLDLVVDVPVSRVTSCAFGGTDLGDLYITTASTGLTEDERRLQPHAGALFHCRPGLSGLPATPFAA